MLAMPVAISVTALAPPRVISATKLTASVVNSVTTSTAFSTIFATISVNNVLNNATVSVAKSVSTDPPISAYTKSLNTCIAEVFHSVSFVTILSNASAITVLMSSPHVSHNPVINPSTVPTYSLIASHAPSQSPLMRAMATFMAA